MRLTLLLAIALCAGGVARGQFQPPMAKLRGTLAGQVTPIRPVLLSAEDTTRLQIFLEREGFSPGKLDGRPGEFTRKALGRYALAARREAPPIGPGLLAALPGVGEIAPYARYTVTTADTQAIGSVPATTAAQGKLKALPYTSLMQLLGERFHADPEFLRWLNRDRDLGRLTVGDAVRVPNVAEPLYVGRGVEVGADGHTLVPRPELRPRVVVVHVQEKLLDVLEDDHLLASFPITPGSSALPAPPGIWKIEAMASLPVYRYDESVLQHGVRSANFVHLPPGPNSPVGIMWMGLDRPGIGLHGTNHPETIGRAASHGCIRLANWDAVRLAQLVTVGVTVRIDGDGAAH